jgi:hypothetical protein
MRRPGWKDRVKQFDQRVLGGRLARIRALAR